MSHQNIVKNIQLPMLNTPAIAALRTANHCIDLSENKEVVRDMEILVEKWCSILDKVTSNFLFQFK